MVSLSIGRDPDCDVVLADPSVSRRHAQIEQEGTYQFRIIDLGSSNGIYVRHRSRWIKVDDANVERDTGVLLGQIETTIGDLIDMQDAKDRRERPRAPRPKTFVQAGGPPGAARGQGDVLEPDGDESMPQGSSGPARPRAPIPKTIDAAPPDHDLPPSDAARRAAAAAAGSEPSASSQLSDFHLMVAGAIAISIALLGIVFAALHVSGIVSTFLYHLVLVIVTVLYAGILSVFTLFLSQFFGYRDLNIFLYALIVMTLALNIFNFVFITGTNNAAWDSFLQNWSVLLPYALFSLVYGVVLIVFGIKLLGVADRFAGLLKPYSLCMIAAGSLYGTVLFSLLGVPDLFVGAANVMLGLVFLEWASMMRRESVAA